jgi:four helix bundle protein
MTSYRDLIVWQKSMSLVTLIYQLVSVLPENEKYGLTPQIKRSAISIPSNIAEGYGRNYKKIMLDFYKLPVVLYLKIRLN